MRQTIPDVLSAAAVSSDKDGKRKKEKEKCSFQEKRLYPFHFYLSIRIYGLVVVGRL
jgi:hypothetical protein